MSTDQSNCCPLCERTQGKVIDEISYHSIWSALADEWGAAFDDEVKRKHTPGDKASLLECANCGLHFFSPAMAGDSAFYSQLTSTAPNYYSDDKWDFEAALETMGAGDLLLDVACGAGAWLRRADAKGVNAYGIDTNPAAIAQAKNMGLQAECCTVERFSTENTGRFDVVTSFQVIEHIPAVLPFVKAAADCLKPGGKLILTVPNRLRSFRRPLEPLDCPPHHVSRWSEDQFTVLAQLAGLTLTAVQYQPAPMAECRAVVRRYLASSGNSESLWARAIARAIFGPTLYKCYAHLGLLETWRLRGMSLMAILTK